jgi:AraC-like DNA-binding protein
MTYYGEMNATVNFKQEKPTPNWHYPDFAAPYDEEIIQKEIVYDDEYGKGTGKEILLEGVYVWYGRIQVQSPKPILIRSMGSHIQLNFCMQSTTSYFSENASKPFIRFKPHQHNMILLPQKDMLVQWQPGEETESFAINITPDFLFNNLPKKHPVRAHFRRGMDRSLPEFLSRQNLPLTSKMISTLFELIHCNYSDYHKSLFIKAKVIELLALQFEQYEQLPLLHVTSFLKQEDVEKMHAARQILIDNIEKPLSLRDLAHQVGTNEYNLKKHFKVIFGKTVFGYLHDFRMDESKRQLCQEGSKIVEVAQRMGYKHATHFTAAFKKHFGFLPNKMRVGLLHLLHFSYQLTRFATETLQDTLPMEMI